MKWNPDPRWPEHIVCLAKAIANGEDCNYALHDALAEIGCLKAAKDILEDKNGTGVLPYKDEPLWTASYVVGLILKDGYEDDHDSGVKAELDTYLRSRECSRKP